MRFAPLGRAAWSARAGDPRNDRGGLTGKMEETYVWGVRRLHVSLPRACSIGFAWSPIQSRGWKPVVKAAQGDAVRRAIFSRRQPSCSTHARSTYHRQRRGEENQPGRREKSRSPTQSRCMRASEKGLPAALAYAADARLYGLEPKRPGGEGGRVFATSLCRSWRDRWQPCVARYWGLTILGVCPARRPGHYRPD